MNNVIEYYTFFGEKEWSRLEREPIEFQVNWHYIMKLLPKTGEILDNGAGPGKYSMELARLGYYITLTDLTPKLVEIAREKAKELNLVHQFRGFHVLNATNLAGLEDEQFDACLMMGPLYHLQSEHVRIAAVKELHRVTKRGGVVFVAFRSRINHVLLSLLFPEHWKPNDNMDEINEFLETGIFNHSDQGRFTGAYFFKIEEIKPFMEAHGFKSLHLIGSTNIGATFKQEHLDYWRKRGELSKVMDLLKKTAADPYVLGMSSHLLYIGQKVVP
ncbi:class I SAM-dependent methyltransferase [Thermoflavimicrobium dichotomicum]|uniref:Methyltransferase domain-containing protein n=1 Tax=Thermoflavimicrobium dichotomicum TaxID=46223 RepID=A0A1I3P8G5_9BACL|nr:class I SAM-dependent methyltransferase [Thermoflavimicrobium dichotomicum]SFJ17326.1 Methyltransferase domain-containing protein [Thermoflavimicrobium dichotomicum]